MKTTFRGHLLGSNLGGNDEGQDSEGSSRLGSLMEVTEGLRKWAVLRMGLFSPESETMSSFLSSMMESDCSAIVGDRESQRKSKRDKR